MHKKTVINSATKANATRVARAEFKQKYPNTYETVRDIFEQSEEYNEVCYSTGHIAAVKANLFRSGPFRDLAHKCNWKINKRSVMRPRLSAIYPLCTKQLDFNF